MTETEQLILANQARILAALGLLIGRVLDDCADEADRTMRYSDETVNFITERLKP